MADMFGPTDFGHFVMGDYFTKLNKYSKNKKITLKD